MQQRTHQGINVHISELASQPQAAIHPFSTAPLGPGEGRSRSLGAWGGVQTWISRHLITGPKEAKD